MSKELSDAQARLERLIEAARSRPAEPLPDDGTEPAFANAGKKHGRAVQLVHTCGRNLAQVYWDESNPTWTCDELVVSPNQGVKQEDYRPWPHVDADTDWHARTYTWHCRCGKTVTRRHEQISQIWDEFKDKPYRRGVWRVVLAD